MKYFFAMNSRSHGSNEMGWRREREQGNFSTWAESMAVAKYFTYMNTLNTRILLRKVLNPFPSTSPSLPPSLIIETPYAISPYCTDEFCPGCYTGPIVESTPGKLDHRAGGRFITLGYHLYNESSMYMEILKRICIRPLLFRNAWWVVFCILLFWYARAMGRALGLFCCKIKSYKSRATSVIYSC